MPITSVKIKPIYFDNRINSKFEKYAPKAAPIGKVEVNNPK